MNFEGILLLSRGVPGMPGKRQAKAGDGRGGGLNLSVAHGQLGPGMPGKGKGRGRAIQWVMGSVWKY